MSFAIPIMGALAGGAAVWGYYQRNGLLTTPSGHSILLDKRLAHMVSSTYKQSKKWAAQQQPSKPIKSIYNVFQILNPMHDLRSYEVGKSSIVTWIPSTAASVYIKVVTVPKFLVNQLILPLFDSSIEQRVHDFAHQACTTEYPASNLVHNVICPSEMEVFSGLIGLGARLFATAAVTTTTEAGKGALSSAGEYAQDTLDGMAQSVDNLFNVFNFPGNSFGPTPLESYQPFNPRDFLSSSQTHANTQYTYTTDGIDFSAIAGLVTHIALITLLGHTLFSTVQSAFKTKDEQVEKKQA